jgi:prolyl-tRNA synthetase
MEKIATRKENYAQWYQDVIRQAELAENSGVRGCMVIRPNGYGIWEKMQSDLDRRFKETGHVNAYFPMFIPLSLLAKEEEHASGFAKECAVVTHHRLKTIDGKVVVDPSSKLEEPLVVRPTSETIIWNQYRGWIQSYRDLPLLINQWANVCRWEMRTRLFLRTAEFLWQEGHTAHASKEDALAETHRMLEVYADFAQTQMAMPVIRGRKTPGERFAGAEETLTIESMMQDGRALQAGTSHYLGQSFSKAADVKFLNTEGKLDFVYATSWGVSTRLIGALIMTHSDDTGLVLPPRLATTHVVIVPIFKSDAERAKVLAECDLVLAELKSQGLSVKLDVRDNMSPGAKFFEWESKGVPVRIEVGPRDVDQGTLCVVRRFLKDEDSVSETDLRRAKKSFVPRAKVLSELKSLILDSMQQDLLERAVKRRNACFHKVDSKQEFEAFAKSDASGFAFVHWAGSREDEEKLGSSFETSIRCIPFESDLPDEMKGTGTCPFTGRPSAQRVVMAKAY